jgi:cell division protein FtsB
MAKHRKNAFLEAKVAALEAQIAALQADNTQLRRDNVRMTEQLAIHAQVPALQRMSFDALKEQARKWANEGVPCHIRSGHIIHSITKAVLL